MKTVSKTAMLLMAGLMATASLSGAVFADDAVKVKSVEAKVESAKETVNAAVEPAKEVDKAAASKSATETIVVDTINISGQAKSILTDIGHARFSLFEGQTDAAMTLVEKARAAFNKDLADYSIKLAGEKSYGVPLDYSIEFAEDFKPTANNAKEIEEAGKML